MTRPIADVVLDDIRANPNTTVVESQARVRFGERAMWLAFASLCARGDIEHPLGSRGWRAKQTLTNRH